MVTGGAALGVAVIAFGMVITPGPNMMYLVSRSLSQGRLAGLVSLAGVVAGFVMYVVATAAGLSVLFAQVPVLFVTVKFAGALYLLWLALAVLRGGREVFRATDLAAHSPRRLFAMGAATCLLNPKIALMYAALLPQFVEPARGGTALQILQLGGVQIIVAATVNAAWVVLAAQLAVHLRGRRTAERVVRAATGALLGAFAVHLALSSPSTARPA